LLLIKLSFSFKKNIYNYDYKNEEIISKREKIEILLEDMLPKKREYFDFHSIEIDEYLSCLKIYLRYHN